MPMLTPLDLPLADIMTMDRELVRLTRGYARERLRFGEVLALLGRGFREHGFRTFGMYVKERASQKVGFCTEARSLSRRLAELPAIREALLSGGIGWSMAVLLSRHALPHDEGVEDERELLAAVRGCSIREVRAALKERGGAVHPEEALEEENELDPLVTIDVPMQSREELLAIEGVRIAIQHMNGGEGEPGEWFECLMFEGASSLMDRLDLELPDVRRQVDAARESRRLGQEVLARAEEGARPMATPVLEDASALSDDEVDLDGLDLVGLDRLVVELGARLASRDVWLGRLLSRLLLAQGWRQLGYASEQHYFDARLGVARSTARGRVTMARRMVWLEGLDVALQEGVIGYEHAALISRVANPDTLQAWIERARMRTHKHLREEVRAAELLARVVDDSPVGAEPPSDEELEAVFAFEGRVISGEMIANAVRISAATEDEVEPVEHVEEDEAVQMSAVSPRLRSGSFSVRTREGVALYYRALEAVYRESGRPGSFVMFCIAAFWREWGARFEVGNKWKIAIFDRDRHRCCSPVCDCPVCTNHHLKYRAHGGGDEPENQITGCDFCHLDGEHGGRLKVRGTASRQVWIFGRTPIMRVEGRTKMAA